MVTKNDKKTINAWAMYDWANSVYSLVITSTIFPIYYNAITSSPDTDRVLFLGLSLKNTVLYSLAISFSFLIIASISPLLGAVADYSGKKKRFMRFFCYLGAFSCMSLFFFTGTDTLGWGIAAFMLASIGFSGSIVFYNAYLPEIATPRIQDKVSAKGYALGYIGSVILLLFNLLMVTKPEWLFLSDEGQASRISFITVGLWWIGFAQITFSRLPKNVYQRKSKGNIFIKGYAELGKVLHQLKSLPHLRYFLIAFFFAMMGVQTVMYMAASFGEKELQLSAALLISTILIIQIIAIAGAFFFSWFSGKKGNINSLILAIMIWVGICIAAYFVRTPLQFIIVAAFVGLVMGGIQSLSRSTYSKLLPSTYDHAAFFGFYDVAEKVAIVIGMASFGIIEELTGSMRNSVFVLMSFFIASFFLLLIIKRLKPASD